MKRVLLLCPTQWDLRQLASCRAEWQGEFEIALGSPTELELGWDFDVPAYVERCAEEYRGQIDGVFASCDYPGAAAAALLARRLDLPGASPRAVLGAAHKFHARGVSRRAVPEATPRFELLDPDGAAPALGFPCFVKPVKGLFSLWARRIDGPAELARLLANPALHEFMARWPAMFERLIAPYPELVPGASSLLAEELLGGALATVEGFRQGARVEILGVVDSAVRSRDRQLHALRLSLAAPAGSAGAHDRRRAPPGPRARARLRRSSTSRCSGTPSRTGSRSSR